MAILIGQVLCVYWNFVANLSGHSHSSSVDSILIEQPFNSLGWIFNDGRLSNVGRSIPLRTLFVLQDIFGGCNSSEMGDSLHQTLPKLCNSISTYYYHKITPFILNRIDSNQMRLSLLPTKSTRLGIHFRLEYDWTLTCVFSDAELWYQTDWWAAKNMRTNLPYLSWRVSQTIFFAMQTHLLRRMPGHVAGSRTNVSHVQVHRSWRSWMERRQHCLFRSAFLAGIVSVTIFQIWEEQKKKKSIFRFPFYLYPVNAILPDRKYRMF